MEFSPRILVIAERDGWSCHYCARDLSPHLIARPNVVTIDHVIPRDFGGPNQKWNYLLACGTCNRRKGNRSYEQFTGKRTLPERMWSKAVTTDAWRKKYDARIAKRIGRIERRHSKRAAFEVLDPVSVLGGWSYD